MDFPKNFLINYKNKPIPVYVVGDIRYRYFVVTGQRLEPLEIKLSEIQLFALRFAPDEELAGLVARAITEHLSPDDIKKAVQNWKADDHRV